MNNAGNGVYGPFAETTEEEFDHLTNVQVKGVFFLTQKLLPVIKDGGRIINTSSDLAGLMVEQRTVWQADGLLEEYTHYRRNDAAAITSGVHDAISKPRRFQTLNHKLLQTLSTQFFLNKPGSIAIVFNKIRIFPSY